MFTDEIRIQVKGGNGGNGCQSYAKTTQAAFKGPDGGSGGRGGDLYLVVDPRINSLNLYRQNRHHKADDGRPGGKHADGKDSGPKFLKVPPGTCVFAEDGFLLADLNYPDQKFLVAKGGRGGRGNRDLITKTIKVPRFAEKGEPGEELWIRLELKLTADIGIIGFPNAGKSTLISKLSNARPKIASYPFTTLEPNLGMVYLTEERSMLMADIPGIIEGAHEGAGLGHKFLRHVERCGFLLHLVDLFPFEERDPWDSYVILNRELVAYSEKLANKLQVIALNKSDMPETEERREQFLKMLKESLPKGQEMPRVLTISALTGSGLDELKYYLADFLSNHPSQIEIFEDQIVERRHRPLQVSSEGDGVFLVSGDEIERICSQVDWNNPEAVEHVQKLFYRRGIIDSLKELGVEQGDLIRIGKVAEMDYQDDAWDHPFES